MDKKKIYYSQSIENESLIRKFSVIFLVISLLPMLVLFYFYTQLKETSQIEVSLESFNLALTFIVLGVLLGFGTMRRIIKNLVDLANANRNILQRILSPQKIKDLTVSKNEIAVLAESFSVITDKLEENVRELQMAKNTIYNVMNKVAMGMATMEHIDKFLELILETITEAMAGKQGFFVRCDHETKSVWIQTSYGVKPNVDGQEMVIAPQDAKFIWEAVQSRKPIYRNCAEDIVVSGPFLFFPFIMSPLVIKDQVLGVVIISGRQINRDFDESEANLLFHISSQTAVAIENSQLNKNIEQTYFETISALALAVDAKDRYSRGHLDRVAKYSELIGQQMGLEDAELKILTDAARLHDLGKIGIPDDVLGKDTQLTVDEWVMMRKHPEIGESIIKPIRSLAPLCDLIRHHHEKLDGSGYPDGLRGDEIMPLTRILAIADIFDALTTDRSYRKKSSSYEACSILKGMGDQVDQDVMVVLEEVVNNRAGNLI